MAIVRGYLIEEGGAPYSYDRPLLWQFDEAVKAVCTSDAYHLLAEYRDQNGSRACSDRTTVVVFGQKSDDFKGLDYETAASLIEANEPIPVEIGAFLWGKAPAFAKVNLSKPKVA